MVGNNPLPEQHKDAMTQLVEERERLEGLLKSIRESIENAVCVIYFATEIETL